MRVPSRSPGQQPGPAVASTAPARRVPARPRPAGPHRADPTWPRTGPPWRNCSSRWARWRTPPSTAARQVLLDQRLREPAIAAVLDATPQGFVGARETLLLEMARYQPNARSSARDLTALVRIYLLSRIDVMWWRGRAHLPHRRAGQRAAPTWSTWSGCAAASLLALPLPGAAGHRRRPGRCGRCAAGCCPDATPRTAGLKFRRARREMRRHCSTTSAGSSPGPPRRPPRRSG